MGKKYDVESISILEGVDAVRKRMAFYLGDTGPGAIYQSTKELIDNCTDEFMRGFGKTIVVVLEGDKIVVQDFAAGIPVGKHKSGINTLTAVFTKLHAGGKFGDGAYKKTKGTFGLGATAANAISAQFEVWTYFKNKWYYQAFAKGKPKTDVKKAKPPIVNGKVAKLGTIIKMTPDFSILTKGAALKSNQLRAYMDLLSYLHPGLTLKLYDNTSKQQKAEVFVQNDGLKALLAKRAETLKVELVAEPCVISTPEVDLAIAWCSSPDEHLDSYVSGSPTTQGGTHTKALMDVTLEVLSKYKGRAKFTPSDMRMGMLCLLNVYVEEPEFSSQTKERLTKPAAYEVTKNAILKPLTKYFAANKDIARGICERAAEFAKLRVDFSMSKKLISSLGSKKQKALLPTKLKGSSTKNPKERELFIVEGDSALGTCAAARDARFQEVLPIRGKFTNVYGQNKGKVAADESIMNIMRAVGYDHRNLDKNKPLRVGKIILLADEDEDGHHLTVILLSLLNSVLPSAIVNKMVYIVDASLFSCVIGQKKYYGNTRRELLKSIPKGKTPSFVTRIKGWGEVNPDLLREVAFNKNTRKLIRVAPLKESEKLPYVAMVGQDASVRRQLLGLN